MKTLITILLAAAALVAASPAQAAKRDCTGWRAWGQNSHLRLDGYLRSTSNMTCAHGALVVKRFLLAQVRDEKCAEAAAEGDGCIIERGYTCSKRSIRHASCRLRGHVVRFREKDTDRG